MKLKAKKILRLKNHTHLGEYELEVGRHYWVQGRYARFIRVTRKGFNFLDEEYSCCLFYRHLYDRRYSGRDIPFGKTKFICQVDIYYTIKVADVV